MAESWIAHTPGGAVVVRRVDGELVVDLPRDEVFRAPLTPIEPPPTDFRRHVGWYAVGDRTVLVTQYPEPFFGEPMLMCCDGDAVTRLYPVADGTLMGEDGSVLDLSKVVRSSAYVEHDFGTGTLILPTGPGPHAVAIQVHGAAIVSRDFNRLFAQPFLDAGIGVYVYDKAPEGTIFSWADGVEAAIDQLAASPLVDAARVGLAGFSNGMWSVPIVAARREVAFIAGIGAPGVSMAGSETHRRIKLLRDAGVSAESAEVVGTAWRLVFAIAGAGSATPEQTAQLSAALAAVTRLPDLDRYVAPEYVRNNPMLSPLPPSYDAGELIGFLTGPGDPELNHDPAADYAQLRCPIYLQYGEFDTSVPVADSVARISAANLAVAVSVYPGLEHMLNRLPATLPAALAGTSIGGFHGFRFGEGVRADLTAWLKKNVS
ncbi:MAG: hypothetical protein HOV77_06360 [Hamadaea sp.]|uniref:alpha/beta hydrolase n=1 Tax=Hamadaea sp. TaxID=2024425 RepID=UPI0018136267|nr:hypothetical protein [Hamadaea sp.]NUT18790.1 hypothetical protein [Hamadaea sp.]